MAKTELINNINLRYEIIGEGIPIVITFGGFGALENCLPLAERMKQLGYKVLLWDRPNTAGSDLLFERENLTMIWAKKLHELLEKFNLSPAFLLGISWGAIGSLYHAHAYPSDVRGLILIGYPTDDHEKWKDTIGQTFLRSADLAEQGGIKSILDNLSGGDFFNWPNQFRLCPEKKQQLLEMDPFAFARVMRYWANSMRKGRGEYVGGLDGSQLGSISVPKLFMTVEESDVVHPTRVAEALCKELQNSELVKMPEYYAERWVQMQQVLKKSIPDFFPLIAERIDEFIRFTVKQPDKI